MTIEVTSLALICEGFVKKLAKFDEKGGIFERVILKG